MSGDASRIDGLAERVTRYTAARTTRRGFLHTVGRAAVLVAGTPALATVLASPASARVCGQSGVSPLCDTFTCDATWGWCWYASGCCAGGRLKRICDCCAPNTPNPRGYCPSGTKVLCVVESCGTDPRLQSVALTRYPTDDPAAVSVAVSERRFPNGASIAVLGSAELWGYAGLAASVGRVVGGPVRLTGTGGLDPDVAAELERLSPSTVLTYGPGLEAVRDGLDAAGVRHTTLTPVVGSLETDAAALATWQRERTGRRSALAVLRDPVVDQVFGVVAAVANALRLPIVVGDGATSLAALTDQREVTTTHVVTTDAAAAAGLPGAAPVVGGTVEALMTAVLDRATELGLDATRISLAPTGSPALAAAAATMPVPLVLHGPGGMDVARQWLFDHRDDLGAVDVAGTRATFTTAAQYELQSIANGFDAHLLIGVAGEGLPVIPQPPSEQPVPTPPAPPPLP